MFGYVIINQSELKFKEYDIYKGYYCGLCNSLKKRHGIVGQCTLTYDMTFLALLLTSLYEPELAEEHKRCVVHPMKKHMMYSNKYIDYVADMNVLLSYFKAMDDWNDDHDFLKLLFAKIIKSSDLYPEKSGAIQNLLKDLATFEKNGETNIDLVSGVFGHIMSIIFTPEDDRWRPYLERMGFFLGKYIYILDAYDDLQNDIKKNRYNPFKHICKEDDFEERVRAMLTLMISECTKEFEFLPVVDNANIIRNILYSGVWSRFIQCSEKNKKDN